MKGTICAKPGFPTVLRVDMNAVDQLLPSLRKSFLDEPVPSLVIGELAREVQGDWRVVESALQGKRWSEVDSDTVEEVAHGLISLSVEAFAYYLPAFMLAAMRSPEGEAATYTMYALCPLGSYEAFYGNTCALFTPEQSRSILAFLEALHADESFTLFSDEMKPAMALWRLRAESEC